MSDESVVSSTRDAVVDLLIGACGLATSLLTAVILWWVQGALGFAFYMLTFWFVIPAGAMLSGLVAASGYYGGAWLFGRRPTRLFLINVIVISVATYFFIRYLQYATFSIEGVALSTVMPFPQFLDLVVRATSIGGFGRSSSSAVGGFGYVLAILQIAGFACGGIGVYFMLESQAYCTHCSRYLTRKGKARRYVLNVEELRPHLARLSQLLAAGSVVEAVDAHRQFGDEVELATGYRLSLEIRYCQRCVRHWAQFGVDAHNGRDWKEVSDLSMARFTEDVVSV